MRKARFTTALVVGVLAVACGTTRMTEQVAGPPAPAPGPVQPAAAPPLTALPPLRAKR